jgi:hypothetical protein
MSINIENDFSLGERSWGKIAEEIYHIYQTIAENNK